MARHKRSISIPIVLASFTVLLSVALLIGWTLLILRQRELTNQFVEDTWLLVSGIVSFVLIASVLVLFVVFLVREILEVRRQNSFIDSVTHELRTPLASIKLCLQTIQRTELSLEQLTKLQKMMVDDVDRLSIFIDHVLVASRLQFGKRTYEVSEFVLEDMIKQVTARLSKHYKLKPGAVELDVSGDIVLNTDAIAVETVINNLLDNAIKYSDTAIDIRVGVERLSSGKVSLSIADRGIGIPNQSLKKVFDRFYRVPNEAVNKRRGTGLGLFVVASLIKSLGGTFEATSNGDNLGTVIEVILPSDVIQW